MPSLHPDRLFSSDPDQRAVARRLYAEVKDLPIISPHGHTDPRWFAEDETFGNAAELFLTPDHYLLRMLYSQGIRLEELGIATRAGAPTEPDPRRIWQRFVEAFYLFRGTPSRLWMDHALYEVLGVSRPLLPEHADAIYDEINATLASEAFRPRALLDRFHIEVIATTESPLDELSHHQQLRAAGWGQRVVTAYRPDPVVDPEFEGFAQNVERLGELTGEDTGSWRGYLQAHQRRRAFFQAMGATSTDHGHASARTADLSVRECEQLFAQALRGECSPAEADLFRGQMLTEMARMSLEDGLVMQLHPGSFRNHNAPLYERFGRDKGADIPTRIEYVHALRPLLNRFGNERDFTFILFTLDESTYSRELAPLAGHYPALKLGPAWWFHDSPEGMLRFRRTTTETAGFYNTVGFNDDTRAFLSIPARHDLARRIDCRYLAELVCEHRLPEEEAVTVAHDLAYRLVKRAYRFE
jgi:glucuronate isomerase